jgi:hypothetical protein
VVTSIPFLAVANQPRDPVGRPVDVSNRFGTSSTVMPATNYTVVGDSAPVVELNAGG